MKAEIKLQHLSDPEFTQENRLPSVSDHKWYESKEEALSQKEMALSCCLNGIWKFFYAPNPSSVPEGYELPSFSCEEWGIIPVPAHMELSGYGKPQYTDTAYAWDGIEAIKPHDVPVKHNPTGCYVREFELPEGWSGKQIHLHFEGVETALHCWVNGHYVGYGEDSYTPSVFDITEYLENGKNKLAVEVYRFCSGTWLEDQDFWRMGGIIRDVYLTAQNEIHLNDIDVQVDVQDAYTTGVTNVKLQALGSPAGISWELYDSERKIVKNGALAKSQNAFEIMVENAQLWSAECPNLYKLVLELQDGEGHVAEAVSVNVGFRKIEIKDAVLYFNGKRMIINGVNRHEFCGKKGRAIRREEMEWDIHFLKANNFNAVRCSHYPNNSYWYELCDTYGIYVMDETNLETHGTWHLQEFSHVLPGNNMKWEKACLERAEAMLERDKNHPCIFSWSVGNESWSGQVLYNMSEYFRKRDASRPVHYENCCHDRNWSGTTDFESRMYASPQMAEAYLSNNPEKPYLLCEYSHAMGNSCGNIHKYTDLIDKYPQYAGGFIWDYIDQAIETTDVFGEKFMGYGGDFDDRPCDYNFCTDGIIYADRRPSPKMQEVKFLYQSYRLTPTLDGVEVESKALFEDGSKYRLLWKMEKEGELLMEGELPVEIQAGEKKFFAYEAVLPEVVGEYVITASLIWKENGEESCFGQGVFRVEGKKAEKKEHHFEVIDADTVFSVITDKVTIQYRKGSGLLTSYVVEGKEMIHDSYNTIMPNFWRAPTDNDEGNRMKYRLKEWKMASLYPRAKKVEFEKAEDHANVSVDYELGNGAYCQVNHHICSSGEIQITETLHWEGELNFPELPCFGLTWKVKKDFANVKWYGFGPSETYIDRCKGGKLGVYESHTEREISEYVVPQECGNHVGCRWVELTDEAGHGVRVESAETFEFSALPYTCHEMEQARHVWELPRPYANVLRLNKKQTGVGGDQSWGAWAHEEYQLKPEKNLSFTVTVKAI